MARAQPVRWAKPGQCRLVEAALACPLAAALAAVGVAVRALAEHVGAMPRPERPQTVFAAVVLPVERAVAALDWPRVVANKLRVNKSSPHPSKFSSGFHVFGESS